MNNIEPYSPGQRAILMDILTERNRQDAKWGKQRHLSPHLWHTILSEEVGEAAEATLDLQKHSGGEDAKARYKELRNELIQIAAVAVATVEDFDEQMEERGLIRP